MSILKNILKTSSDASRNGANSQSGGGLSLDESKMRIEELRRTISGLKKRHERSIQLKGATCNTEKSIKRLQTEIMRLKRRYPSIASASQDNYLA